MQTPADNARGSLTVALAMACPYCASPTPVNGPLQAVSCDACLREFEVRQMAEQLESSAEGSDWLNSPFLSTAQSVFEASDVQCGRCEALIPIEPHLDLVGQTTTFPCPSCAASCPSYPAPDWLVTRLPAAVQVFGGDGPPGMGNGVAPETSQESTGAVLMTCPGCAGALQITADVERMMDCKYCGSSVYIPDSLWKRLHPVRLLRRWTLLFRSSELETVETIQEAREELEEARESRDEGEASAAAGPEATTPVGLGLRPDALGAVCTLALGGLSLAILGVPTPGPLWLWPNLSLIVFGALLVGAGLRKRSRATVHSEQGEIPPGRLLVIAGGFLALVGAFVQQFALLLTAQ